MDMMSSFELYHSDMKATAGMYNDAAFTGLPRTIADMAINNSGPFVGVAPPTWENMNQHANKRSRTGSYGGGGGGSSTASTGSISGFSQSSSLSYPSSSTSSWYSAASQSSQSHSESETSSAEEKKMMDRERNRKQARKSRKLKKQTIDKMQQQLEELEKESKEVAARDKAAAEEAKDRRTRRCQALRKVFDLREAGCAHEESWLEVLSPDLRMTMPITPYRSFNPADVVNNRQVLLGVDGMISDTQSLAVTLDNMGVKTRRSEGPVSIKYTLGFEEEGRSGDGDGDGHQRGAFFSRDGLMCTFGMRTLDAVKHGACQEWEVNGMVRVRFNGDTSKIEELDMTFDAISCYQQLMLAAGKEGFPPVPNTLENALKDETTRIVVTTAERPFRITHVNKAWTELCGFELEECQGKSLSILQGPETDMNKVDKLCKLSQKGYASSMVVTNRNKKGETFRNHLRCYPVSSDEPGQISHIVGMLTSIPASENRRSVPSVQAF